MEKGAIEDALVTTPDSGFVLARWAPLNLKPFGFLTGSGVLACTALAHTGLISTKRFTNLNPDVIVLDRVFHISHEFEYFYQCNITSWCLRDSGGPI